MNDDLDLLLAEIDLLKGELELQSNLLGEPLRQVLDIEYTYQSNSLEGSSLTLAETEMAIKIGLTIPGKTMAEYLAAINHYQAVQFIREQAGDQAMLSEALIKQIHGILLRGINREQAGIYRTQPLVRQSLHAPPPAQLPEAISETVQWLRLEGPFMHPVIFAAETHRRLLSLQPFAEANGTCARLLMNLILLEEGYPFANIACDADSCRTYFQALDQSENDTGKTVWWRLVAEQVMADIKALLSRLDRPQNVH